MKQRRRIYYSPAQRSEIWDRWQAGEPMSSIGRRFDRVSSSVFSVISPTGGIRPPARQRARQALSLFEREEFSRGLSMQCSLRLIARQTGIRVTADMPWGAHISLFYETKEDLLDTNAAYIKAGLESNEFCVWAISQPITEDEAWAALHRDVPDLDGRAANGQLEILTGYNWYLPGDEFDSKKITSGWHEKLQFALDRGFDGLRISGNAFWLQSNRWKKFCEYEQELDESLNGRPMLALCIYSLGASRAVDLLDVARAHQFTVARRRGWWEFLETPELKQARQEIKTLGDALFVLSRPFADHKLLTPREQIVLAQIVRGASSKEAARWLGVSPRTIEFHRANVMQKLGAKNVADLVRIVVGNTERSEGDD